MTAPARIDPVAVARSVLADPRKLVTVSTLGIAAVCQALVEHEDQARSIIPDELAVAARALIAAEATYAQAKDPEGYVPLKVGLAREQAFHTFRMLFEQEFPNDHHN